MRYRHALLLILVILVLDQASKIYIKTHFYYGEEVKVIGDWFRLHFIENEGMAFGMKINDAPTGKLLLTLFRLAAVCFGFYLLGSLIRKKYSRGAILCGALILAGAAGNLIDSIFYGMIFTESSFHIARLVPWGQGYGSLFHGKVVDMLYFPLFAWEVPDSLPWIGGRTLRFFEPVFNIADTAITTGVLTLLLFQNRLLHRRGEEEKGEEGARPESDDQLPPSSSDTTQNQRLWKTN